MIRPPVLKSSLLKVFSGITQIAAKLSMNGYRALIGPPYRATLSYYTTPKGCNKTLRVLLLLLFILLCH